MRIKVLIFGQLAEIIGRSEMFLEDISDSEMLTKALHQRYPDLVNSKYAIALDNKVITVNTILSDNSTIALLPPFSGG